MRKKVITLDRGCCVQCGSELNVDVHHIRYAAPCKTKNLVTLCSTCHSQLHGAFKNLSNAPKFSHEIQSRTKEEG